VIGEEVELGAFKAFLQAPQGGSSEEQIAHPGDPDDEDPPDAAGFVSLDDCLSVNDHGKIDFSLACPARL
jgi:hypothetical protein